MTAILIFGCKKKTTTPTPQPAPDPLPVVNTYTLNYNVVRTYTTGDTLKVKLNGSVRGGTFEVHTNDVISFYYNPGTYLGMPDSNHTDISLNNTIVKQYRCTCIANYSFTVQ